MLMYLCPALLDWLLYYVTFAALYGAGLRGCSIWECTLLGISVLVAYMPGSVAAGSILNSRNAKPILIWSTVACGIASVACLGFESFFKLIISLGALGMASAFFFNSFQTFMRSEPSEGMTLKHTVSFYNFAWSIGAGAGSLTAGILYTLGKGVLIGAALTSAVIVVGLLLMHKSSGEEAKNMDGVIEEGSPGARPVNGIYIIVGWMMIFMAQFVQRPLFTFLPPLFANDGVSSFMASLPLFMFLAVQAAVALFMWKLRDHIYRRAPLLIIQGLGAVAIGAIWLWPQYWNCLAMLSLLGLYSGYAFFSSIYFVSNSTRSSFNIGVNEGLVGLGSIAGILGGGLWMKSSASPSSIYLMCALGLAISALLETVVASFRKKA